jgi:hypothetical protein
MSSNHPNKIDGLSITLDDAEVGSMDPSPRHDVRNVYGA